MNNIIKKFLSENGKKGGYARAKNLTPKRLSEIGKHAVMVREKKKREREKQYKGISKERIGRIWYGIIARCNNPNYSNFYLYGGRGIKCLWKNFEEFRKDMSKSYWEHLKKFGEDNTQIDRINNNGNYEINNCRWATRKEQAKNKQKIKGIDKKI